MIAGRRGRRRPAKSPQQAGRPRATRKRKAQHRSRLRSASNPVRVSVATDPSADKFTLLARALEDAGLWSEVEARAGALGVDPGALRIVIKPDMSVFDVPSPTGTDPELVEEMLDLMYARGYTNAIVGSTRDTFDLLLENRGVLALADLAGYRFRTRAGHDYDIVDLAEETVPGAFPAGASLYGSEVSRVWSEAQFRISFCKNRTDETDGFALTLQNLIGTLPLTDKRYHYYQRLRAHEVATELLRAYPVQMAVIDAFTSSHGSAGVRKGAPIETRTIIAAGDPLAADSIAARKMGIEPGTSKMTAHALDAVGVQGEIEVSGNTGAYAGWRNVHPLLAGAAQARNRWPAASWLLSALTQSVNRDLFPFKDLTTDRLNALLVRYAGNPDSDPLAFWLTATMGYVIGAAGGSFETWGIIAAKDSLHRADVALGIDPEAFTNDEYDAVREHVLSMKPLLDSIEPDGEGLRWMFLDHSQLFEYSRVIAVPFEAFVARVDVALTNQFMNDYLGGRIVVTARDKRGRSIRQAERDIYLPQPNFMALSNGKPIDVMKIECAEYSPTRHTLYWKLVRSENDSAAYDDALVSFEKTDDGLTRATIFGRQEFSIPSLWSFIDLPSNAALKKYLVTDAYHRFFARSFANFEAVAEGRDVRLGRTWDATRGEPGGENAPSLEVVGTAIETLLNKIPAGGLQALKRLIADDSGTTTDGELDADGFVHFAGKSAQISTEPTGREDAMAFFKDVVEALRKDFVR
jgi:uncharacterized protein (DUF362 family)